MRERNIGHFTSPASFALIALMGIPSLAHAQSYSPNQPAYQVIQAAPSQQVQQPTTYTSLPSHPGSSYAAPAAKPALQPVSVVPPSDTKILSTAAGIDLGMQASYYEYDEPSVGVVLSGAKVGFTGLVTGTVEGGYFLTGDVRYALGPSDYKGSGTSSDNFEDLWDIRAYGGKDFIIDQQYDLSPYVGIGYRDLYSDERGTTSTGASGYRRENQIVYVPIGVKPRIKVDSDDRIAATAEYDVFIHGSQQSYLGDVSPVYYGTTTNHQSSGYGVRGDLAWETKSWSVGPFITYWSIDKSNSTCSVGSTYYSCGWYEPSNHTLEAGVQFRYHVW